MNPPWTGKRPSSLINGTSFLISSGDHQLRVDVIHLNGIGPATQALQLVMAVRQGQDAALAQHHIEIELATQALVELERVFVERGALRPEIVGARDLGVAPRIAAAQPALFEHRDIADAVFLGQIVSGRKAVAAGPDDDDIVGFARCRTAPRWLQRRCRPSAPESKEKNE